MPRKPLWGLNPPAPRPFLNWPDKPPRPEPPENVKPRRPITRYTKNQELRRNLQSDDIDYDVALDYGRDLEARIDRHLQRIAKVCHILIVLPITGVVWFVKNIQNLMMSAFFTFVLWLAWLVLWRLQ